VPATENLPDLELQLSHRFWNWMERVSWLKPTEDLYATMVEPDLGFDFAAELDAPSGEKVLFVVLAKESIRPSDVATLVCRLRQRVETPEFRQRMGLAGFSNPDSRPYPVLAARWFSTSPAATFTRRASQTRSNRRNAPSHGLAITPSGCCEYCWNRITWASPGSSGI
jgi:hypothetical protein